MFMLRIFKLLTFALLVCTVLPACATKSSNIAPAYVSPQEYSDLSCEQINAEMKAVGDRARDVSGVQDKTASKDAVSVGIGIIFWPAFFATATGDDQKSEIAQLKGKYAALEQVSKSKKCGSVQ